VSEISSIVEMSAWELSKQIHYKKISCKEVMKAYLDQIKTLNPKVNAIVALQDEDKLIKQAEEKDSALMSGRKYGWMHGFPQAIKDLEETKGIPTTYACPVFKNFIPESDSLLVERMKKAGSIVIGKTNTPEWGFGSQTYNEVYGATGNPYDPDLTSGGSSGGAACSVALRMQAVADGSDFMGSLRNPPGWCNVYGYRPAFGRVPSPGLELFMNSFAMRGTIARNVADLALLLSTLSGYDAAAPLSLEEDPNLKSLNPFNVHEKLLSSQKGRKIAWLGDWDGYLPMEDGVIDLCEKALAKFPEFGVDVENIKPPYDPEAFWNEIWLPLRHFSAQALKGLYDVEEKKKLLKPESIFEYEGLSGWSGRDIYFASLKRSDWYRAMLKVFEKYDFIAVPTAQLFPFDKNIHWPEEIAGKKMDTYHRWMEVVTHWTMSGSPVVAIPAGFNENGLPMGIQIVGKPRSDFDLLQFAYAYETRNDWVNTYRPEILG